MYDPPPWKTAARTWCVMEAVLLLSYAYYCSTFGTWHYCSTYVYILILQVIVRNSITKKKKKVWTDVDEDKTSETSETQKQIINKLHATAVIYGIWMFGRKRSPTHTSTSPYSAGIRGQHRSTPCLLYTSDAADE